MNLAWVCELERAGGQQKKKEEVRVDGLDWIGGGYLR